MDEGALPPVTPIDPYLGEMCKIMSHFYMSVHLHTLWKPQFGAKYGPRSPPRAIYEPGGQCSKETPIVSKGLRSGLAGNT